MGFFDMETNRRACITALLFLICSLSYYCQARPNVQRLNPTGYSLEVVTDDAPFSVNNGMTYALPKGMKVKLLGEGSYGLYCQLPDGSRGYMWDRHFGGFTMRLSDKVMHKDKQIKVKPGVYDVLSWGSWKLNKKGTAYEFEYDECRLKSLENGKIVSVPYYAKGKSWEPPYFAHYDKLPKETDKHDVHLIIKNPENVGNLVGMTMHEIESILGHSKFFVGDALTDVGYAYSYYNNVALIEDSVRHYGMTVYYDRNSVCVAASMDRYMTNKTAYRIEHFVKLPAKESKVKPVAINRSLSNGIPRYNMKVSPVKYEHTYGLTMKSMSLKRFGRVFLAGNNVLSALLSILLLLGFFLFAYIFFLKHVEVLPNEFHIVIAWLVGFVFIYAGVYGVWHYGIIKNVLSAFCVISEVYFLVYAFQNKLINERCCNCYYFHSLESSVKRVGGFETQHRTTNAIRRTYSEIGVLERLGDEQVRRWETVYQHELKTSQYGKYEIEQICPRCLALWILKNDRCENEITDIEGYSKRIRTEIWGMREKR